MAGEEKVKLEWPKELLEYLQRAGPFWSGGLGIVLLYAGWRFNLVALQGGGVAILAVGFLLLVSRRPSRLVRKEAFAAVRNVYIGRDQERQQLVDAIERAPLLWISGESGSGKSSLLRNGVVPALREGREFLPLYIEHWGNDWEAGPVAEVTTALREAVTALGADLRVSGSRTAAELAKDLAAVDRQLSRTPVLILDQFDDYIVDNLDHFRPGGGGLIVSASELEAQNAFWREIGQLLRGGKIRCALVVRQEQGWGQGAVAFVKVREFFVPRLQRQFLDQILRDLGKDAVENPERGWDSLRDRLEKDLYASGGILPIQMRFVVQQLASLKRLTVAAYEAAGGVLGLAARYAGEVIDRVAAASGTDAAVVRRVLHKLVNPDDPSKTRDMGTAAMLQEMSGTLDEARLTRVLEQLKLEKLARDHADESRERRWRLDHDYLARVVEELDRRENRLQRVLDERAEEIRASGWRWRKLRYLNPTDLGGILVQSARGRLRIGDARAVVLVSIGFWAATVAVMGLAMWVAEANEFESRAGHYADALDRAGPIEGDEAKEWVKLAEEPLPIRQRVARLFLLDERRAARMASNAARVHAAAAAWGGLSPNAPEHFDLAELVCRTKDSPGCRIFTVQFGGGSPDKYELDHIAGDRDFRDKMGLKARDYSGSTPVPRAWALAVEGPKMSSEQAIRTGKEMLAATKQDGHCMYDARFVRAGDIPTALAALEWPACALEGFAIQRAISEATTHMPAGDVSRWTFAREWVVPNAAKYGYDSERFNGFYYSYIRPLARTYVPKLPMLGWDSR